ncbi:hypothetical protein [Amycolatopsis sp. NPDC051371]|uniref:hypothetical protein n=1 Tax=Amycolatopsis sp. NPDC051371 TaxID=3155800 RepID=UPI003422D476
MRIKTTDAVPADLRAQAAEMGLFGIAPNRKQQRPRRLSLNVVFGSLIARLRRGVGQEIALASPGNADRRDLRLSLVA